MSRVNKPTRRWFDIFVEDFKTSLGTILTFGDIQDGEYLVRSGDKVVGGSGGGGGANCNNWILIGESSDTYRFMLRYYINSAGGYVSNVQSNLAISETGSNFLNAWIGAFSIEDKVVLDQEDVLGYSDVALHSGVLLPVSRANGGTADTNQRCWPTRNELTLRIKTQLVFEAGGLRKLSVTTEELSMLMFGEIS